MGTALVVRSAARDGQRAARAVILGNPLAIFAWAVLAAVGVAAVVAASAEAYTVIKLVGAAVLIVLGCRRCCATATSTVPARRAGATHIRDGLVTGLANPKLGVFFAALFPQFVPEGASLLAMALAMAATIVVHGPGLLLGAGLAGHPRAEGVRRGPVGAAGGAADRRRAGGARRAAGAGRALS